MSNDNRELPRYYRRLNDYFPSEEMKHPQHLSDLVEEEHYYHKHESPETIVLYAKFHDFVFVDYLLVSAAKRGKGLGSRVMADLKSHQLAIVLEVEPASDKDEDTILRRRFYERHGFVQAKRIHYEREDKDGKPFRMDILYWSPRNTLRDETVMAMMETVCHQVHNHNAHLYYDSLPANPDEVLTLIEA